jgi:4-hydroxy-2-oxoglutarate aldolase
MALNLAGILLPATTPFTANEEFDEAGFTRNFSRWSRTGIVGYVVLGSTGERVNLNESEYLRVLEVARRAVPDTLSFIVGAGQQSTRATIQETALAAGAGAEAVLVITPSYYRSAITQSALIEHYQVVADASPVPIILYSMPDLTGIKIEPDTAAYLSEHRNIIGIKDSSADLAVLAETLRLVRPDFAVMTGNGTVLANALWLGVRGAILAVGCAVPGLCLEIYEASTNGERERAAMLQHRLTPLARAVTKTYGIGGLKAALDIAGYDGGRVRSPLPAPSQTACAEIEALLRDATVASEARA